MILAMAQLEFLETVSPIVLQSFIPLWVTYKLVTKRPVKSVVFKKALWHIELLIVVSDNFLCLWFLSNWKSDHIHIQLLLFEVVQWLV